MFWIDDDKDFIVDPSTQFLGYKCPYEYGACDVVTENHNICYAAHLRLKSLADAWDDELTEKNGAAPFNWQAMFEFNIGQWMLKKGYESFVSIPS